MEGEPPEVRSAKDGADDLNEGEEQAKGEDLCDVEHRLELNEPRGDEEVCDQTNQVDLVDQQGKIILLLPLFKSKLVDPYNTFAAKVLGKRLSSIVWRVLSKFTPILVVVWFASTIVGMFRFTAAIEEPPLGINLLCGASAIYLFLCFSFFNVWSTKILLVHTFDSMLMCVMVILSALVAYYCNATSVGRHPFYFSDMFIHIGSLSYIPLLDAAPINIRRGTAAIFGASWGLICMLFLSTYLLLFKESIPFNNPSIYINNLGTESLMHRLYLGPMQVLLCWTCKFLYKQHYFPERSVSMTSPLVEYSFSSKRQAENFLHEHYAATRADLQEHTARCNPGSKIRVLTTVYYPIRLDPHDIVSRRWQLRSLTMLVADPRIDVACIVASIVGATLSCYVLGGGTNQYSTLVSTFAGLAGVAPTISLLRLNTCKLSLLARSFGPVYMVVAALILHAGLLYALRDFRCMVLLFTLPTILCAILSDAQHLRGCRFVQAYRFVWIVGSLTLIIVLLISLYTESLFPLEAGRISLVGLVTEITTTQMFILTPCLNMLPILFFYSYMCCTNPRALFAIRCPLKELKFTDIQQLDSHFGETMQRGVKRVYKSKLDGNFKRFRTTFASIIEAARPNSFQPPRRQSQPQPPQSSKGNKSKIHPNPA